MVPLPAPPLQEWGVTTRKVKKAFVYDTKQTLKTKRTKEGVTIFFDEVPSGTDYIVELEMRD